MSVVPLVPPGKIVAEVGAKRGTEATLLHMLELHLGTLS